MENSQTTQANSLESLGYSQQLQRSMSLTDIVVYGLIYMVPMAPIAVFGITYNFSMGMPALVYLVAATAMVFSALCYKEMAKRYPVAGSVYSYVRFGINSYFGYLAGWAILLDYLLLPALLAVFAASAMTGLWPAFPAWIWVAIFVALATLINLGGISLTATMNKVFLGIQLAVLTIFAVVVGLDLINGRISLSLSPFFNSEGFSWQIVFGAIPIAALSFIGFDAISTLNEEARGGGETVSKATMIVLVAVAFLFMLQVYLAALYVPDNTIFSEGDQTNNAFYNIAGQIGGDWLRILVTLSSALIAIFANSLASMATSSRLIFSMARDRQLPSFLAAVSSNNVPRNATLLISVLSLLIGIFGAENQGVLTTLVTFGALTAYILLNIAVLVRFGLIDRSRKLFLHWLSPLIGTAILSYALWHADYHAQIAGTIWMIVGVCVALSLKMSGHLGRVEQVS
ncbi:APC family permease [Phyllobacterium sp. 21LDTY02-6]|uniref:APC family permease n=1 Tax=unclassified Phyllobacterium TaxID=2638441 RepID=UPI0020200893|nr:MULTISPECIES: APC family permease [unclassified Phyllobacterium]MCO4319103.1 APC family permease [Phyllobacterium sp. 21LDTY02-6]MCX8279011.1 APC family permease [Phyllobacterium sp. 0TCS1.6C]MCX8293795.1 APC family permease [Phyllobacterium sp. 0TCS1.6A]